MEVQGDRRTRQVWVNGMEIPVCPLDAYSWGEKSSGALRLSFAILNLFISADEALALCEDLVNDFIGKMSQEDFISDSFPMGDWIAAKRLTRGR